MNTGSPQKAEWGSCPVCGSDRRRGWVAFVELEFVRCESCRTVYKACENAGLRPRDFYETAYFHGRKSARDKRFEHRVRKAGSFILAGLEYCKAERFIDVGCSLGYGIEAAKRMGLQGAGVDISEYAVQHCNQRGYQVKQASIESLPWPDSSFDLVLMQHVLEHSPEPLRVLSEVRRIIAPGGAVIILVPNLRYWKGILLKKSYRYYRPDDLGMQHYVYYTRKTLRRLLEKAGFRVRATSKAFFRRRAAGRSFSSSITEILRFASAAAGQALAGAFGQRREVMLIATLDLK